MPALDDSTVANMNLQRRPRTTADAVTVYDQIFKAGKAQDLEKCTLRKVERSIELDTRLFSVVGAALREGDIPFARRAMPQLVTRAKMAEP